MYVPPYNLTRQLSLNCDYTNRNIRKGYFTADIRKAKSNAFRREKTKASSSETRRSFFPQNVRSRFPYIGCKQIFFCITNLP